ncbi:hypothetical protein [Nocardia sp. NPDC051750]|uniref:hypothetical protein n=1 Tax=Nocardia sp. NPDC051750 TaxID=3364325 RepID=UPI00378F0DF2
MSYGGEPGARRVPVSRWWMLITSGVGALVALCCAGLVWVVGAESDFGYLLVLVCVLLGLGVVWLAFAAIGLIRYRTFLPSVVAPAAVVIAVALVWSGAAQRIAWQVSRGALERAAVACEPRSGSSRIGVYTIESVRRAGVGCHFYTTGGFLDRVGFAYLPEGAPPERPAAETTYRHHDGHWYRFTVRM